MAISTAMTPTTRTAGSRIFGNHRRSPSNVSNSSSNTNSSNINPSFRLEDEIDSQFSSPNSTGQRVAFDLDPPRASQTSASIRPTRQNSEIERPGTLVSAFCHFLPFPLHLKAVFTRSLTSLLLRRNAESLSAFRSDFWTCHSNPVFSIYFRLWARNHLVFDPVYGRATTAAEWLV